MDVVLASRALMGRCLQGGPNTPPPLGPLIKRALKAVGVTPKSPDAKVLSWNHGE